MGVILPPDDEARLVRAFFGTQAGYFVDVGAHDPQEDSQTFHLEQRGWTGVLIEPQPDLAEKLRLKRKATVVDVACSTPENAGRTSPFQLAGRYSSLNDRLPVATALAIGTIEVPVRTLDQVLLEAEAPAPIDFVSIDVEGHEVEVLRGFDLQHWRPRLILIEDHVLDRRLHEFLTSRAFAWVRRTGLNSWYVPSALAPRLTLAERLQFFRKYYLGVPLRQLRQSSRRLRRKLGLARDPEIVHREVVKRRQARRSRQ